MSYQPKVNDIFYINWDNFPECFQVVKVSASKKSVTLKEIDYQKIDYVNHQHIYEPIKDSFKGKEFRKKISSGNNKIISFPTRGAFLLENKTITI